MPTAKPRRFQKVAVVLLVLCALLGFVIGLPTARLLQQQSLDRRLITAIRHNDTPVVLELLQQGADANCRDEPMRRGWVWQTLRARLLGKQPAPTRTLTALLLATRPHEEFEDLLDAPDHPVNALDNLPLIRALLDHGANPNARDPQGFTALLYTIRWQKYATADLLLTHRADPDEGDKNRVTPLMIAVYMADPQAIRLLLDHGAPIDRQDDISGQTALMLAVTLKRPDCIAPLIARHPDLTIRDYNGKTALDYAKAAGYGPDLLPLKQHHAAP